ncbi:MAG: hypothetical protein H6737_09810 [Alphaproteobacteria bacterium]|nr:hypothetical protein [Alphaproteobacteria bacterium]
MRLHLRDDVGPEGWVFHPPRAEYGYGPARLAVGPDAIDVWLKPGVDASIARLLVLGPGLAGVLANRVPVIHGTTLRTAVGDVVLVGPSGMGKSSFSAAWIRRGARLVADDIAALDGRCVRPGPPRLKLWEDGIAALGLDGAARARIHPEHAKFGVAVPGVDSAAPVARIVLIERGEGSARVSPAEAHGLLLANHRLPGILTPEAQVRWLHAMAALARDVPVWRVCLPGPLDALDGLVASFEASG